MKNKINSGLIIALISFFIILAILIIILNKFDINIFILVKTFLIKLYKGFINNIPNIVNIFLMLLLISILILVHEAGHFIAARMCGVRVTRFGFGMPVGKSWKLFKIGHTQFYLHAFLFGGYVAFPDDEPESNELSATALSECRLGQKDVQHVGSSDELVPSADTGLQESNELSATALSECRLGQKDVQHVGSSDELVPSADTGLQESNELSATAQKEIIIPEKKDNETIFEQLKRKYLEFKKEIQQKQQEKINEENEEEKLPPDSPELYENKTIGQKLFIVSAGVLMNIVFAIILVIFCAIYYHKLPAQNQNIYIDKVINKTYNLKQGAKVYKINGYEINTTYQLAFFINNSRLFDDYAQKDLIEKNEKEIKNLNPEIKDIIKANTEIKLPSIKPENSLSVNKNVLKGFEKYKKDGIKLTKNQIKLRNEINGKNIFISNEDISLNDLIYALSDTYKPIEYTFLQDNKEIIIKNIKIDNDIKNFAFKTEYTYTETKTFKDIIVKSVQYLWDTTVQMLFSLWQLITGKVNASDVHGIIAIVKVGADIIAIRGMMYGLLLTAMISLNLAIMNFLPIPALDGGHVLFLIIEKLTGKKPSKELGEKITNFFFILLILLMILICYNDIFALVTKKF